MDRDPSETFDVVYNTESSFAELELFTADELVDLKSLPTAYASKRYSRAQIPHALKLRVNGRLQKPVYYFNVTASVSGGAAETSACLRTGSRRPGRPGSCSRWWWATLARPCRTSPRPATSASSAG